MFSMYTQIRGLGCVQDSKHTTPSICITNTDSVGEADTGVEFNIYSNQKFHGFFRVEDEFVQADVTRQVRLQHKTEYGLVLITGWLSRVMQIVIRR